MNYSSEVRFEFANAFRAYASHAIRSADADNNGRLTVKEQRSNLQKDLIRNIESFRRKGETVDTERFLQFCVTEAYVSAKRGHMPEDFKDNIENWLTLRSHEFETSATKSARQYTERLVDFATAIFSDIPRSAAEDFFDGGRFIEVIDLPGGRGAAAAVKVVASEAGTAKMGGDFYVLLNERNEPVDMLYAQADELYYRDQVL